MSRVVEVFGGWEAWVDEADFPAVVAFKWHVDKCGDMLYISRTGVRPDGKRRPIRLHRELMGFPEGKVDHVNGNTFDCQRGNLRVCSQTENTFNNGISRRNRSGFKGVHGEAGKFCAKIQCGAVIRIERGFALAQDAARLYDSWASELFGQFARLNFPKP